MFSSGMLFKDYSPISPFPSECHIASFSVCALCKGRGPHTTFPTSSGVPSSLRALVCVATAPQLRPPYTSESSEFLQVMHGSLLGYGQALASESLKNEGTTWPSQALSVLGFTEIKPPPKRLESSKYGEQTLPQKGAMWHSLYY